jgi:hypothetical protein
VLDLGVISIIVYLSLHDDGICDSVRIVV